MIIIKTQPFHFFLRLYSKNQPMKTFYKIFLLTAITFFLSCQSDNESNFTQDRLAREWKLTKVEGGLLGVNQSFEAGIITWSFNSLTNTVTIVNSNTDDTLYDMFETSVYNYQIVDNPTDGNCDEILKIDNIELGCISFINNQLILDQAISDGFKLYLKK